MGKICDKAEEGKEGKRLLRQLKPFFIMKLNGSIDLNSLPIQQMYGKVGDVSGLADKLLSEWVRKMVRKTRNLLCFNSFSCCEGYQST